MIASLKDFPVTMTMTSLLYSLLIMAIVLYVIYYTVSVFIKGKWKICSIIFGSFVLLYALRAFQTIPIQPAIFHDSHP